MVRVHTIVLVIYLINFVGCICVCEQGGMCMCMCLCACVLVCVGVLQCLFSNCTCVCVYVIICDKQNMIYMHYICLPICVYIILIYVFLRNRIAEMQRKVDRLFTKSTLFLEFNFPVQWLVVHWWIFYFGWLVDFYYFFTIRYIKQRAQPYIIWNHDIKFSSLVLSRYILFFIST